MPAPPYARVTNSAGKQLYIKLEVADTPEKRATGLMNRTSLVQDAGMVFVFPTDTRAPFWMKDTLIPLSIAFIASDGTIVNIQDMQPLTTTTHAPSSQYRYALEVNQGYFRDNGVTAGDRVEFQLGG